MKRFVGLMCVGLSLLLFWGLLSGMFGMKAAFLVLVSIAVVIGAFMSLVYGAVLLGEVSRGNLHFNQEVHHDSAIYSREEHSAAYEKEAIRQARLWK